MYRLLQVYLLGTVGLWLPPWFPLLEIWSNCSLYLFLISCLFTLLVCLAPPLRFRRNLILLLLSALLSGLRTIPLEEAPLPPTFGASRLKVLWANLERTNSEYRKFREMIKLANPDIFAVAEVTPEWEQQIRVLDGFPYSAVFSDPGYFGIGVWSKTPLPKPELIQSDFGSDVPKALLFTVTGNEGQQPLTIVALHALPPLNPLALETNRLLLRRIATEIRARSSANIILGDFNATPSSTFYRRFVNWLELRNAFSFGWSNKTWNAHTPLFHFALDHILVSKQIEVIEAQVLPPWGSDHYPLMADLSLP